MAIVLVIKIHKVGETELKMLRFALEVTEYVTADFRLFRDKVRQATMSCFGLDMCETEILGILQERCWQGVRNRGRPGV